jgi:uncharacterized protein (DUF488 family)
VEPTSNVPRRIATIGVYGFSALTFIETLVDAGVGRLLDVRQRRGVRGAQYAWANSLRLQRALSQASIAYEHHRELAPTTELRHLQYREDERTGVGKRTRAVLAPEYRRRYTAEILDRADLDGLVASLPVDVLVVLLCVEREPSACHRSLIAARLAERYGMLAVDLLPPPDQGASLTGT